LRSKPGAPSDFNQLRHHNDRCAALPQRDDQPDAVGRYPAGLHWRRTDLDTVAALIRSLDVVTPCLHSDPGDADRLHVSSQCLLPVVDRSGIPILLKTRVHKDGYSLPVTIMVPLYGADLDAYDNYARFCRRTILSIKSYSACATRETPQYP